jgi:hypothetical protein
MHDFLHKTSSLESTTKIATYSRMKYICIFVNDMDEAVTLKKV